MLLLCTKIAKTLDTNVNSFKKTRGNEYRRETLPHRIMDLCQEILYFGLTFEIVEHSVYDFIKKFIDFLQLLPKQVGLKV